MKECRRRRADEEEKPRPCAHSREYEFFQAVSFPACTPASHPGHPVVSAESSKQQARGAPRRHSTAGFNDFSLMDLKLLAFVGLRYRALTRRPARPSKTANSTGTPTADEGEELDSLETCGWLLPNGKGKLVVKCKLKLTPRPVFLGAVRLDPESNPIREAAKVWR